MRRHRQEAVEFRAGSPVDANPITYSVGGKQYVTVISGRTAARA